MERVSVLTKATEVTTADLPFELRTPGVRSRNHAANGATTWDIPAGGLVFEEWEKNLLAQALARSDGNMADAAKLLGMTYRTFQYRSMKFGLKGI
jgi:DNA-binding NtrC family response regulator